ncbi:MAG TPA: cobalamin-dependent protein [Anaeromyxobacter sp.]
MSAKNPIKMIVTMIGLDGHTTGGQVIATLLKDAGVEVVYLGCNQTPEMIAHTALQEAVDAVGISSHASNYGQIEELVQLLRRRGLEDVPVICGGNIPRHAGERLKAAGVAEIFPPGSSREAILDYVFSLRARRAAAAPAST